MNKGASVEDCLKLHPESSAELEPLLSTFNELQIRTAFVPTAEAKAKGRSLLHHEMDRAARKQGSSGRYLFSRLLAKPKAWAPAATALVLAIITFTVWSMFNSEELKALQGTIQNADSVSGTVTVQLKDGTTTTFDFTDVQVETARNALGSATFETGDQVTIKRDKNGRVEQLRVENADIEGKIKSLGTDTVTITTEKKRDITLQVTPESLINTEHEGNEGTAVLSDLQVGQSIEAKYRINGMRGLKLDVNAGTNERLGVVEGNIKALGDDSSAMILATKDNQEIVLQVTSGTIIKVEDKGRGAFSELRTGQKVEVSYDRSSVNALKLKVGHNGNSGKNVQQGKNDRQGNDDRD
jgi:hypothetical protein